MKVGSLESMHNYNPQKPFCILSLYVDAGMTTLSAAWQTLQENAERMAVKVLAGQASNILSQARAAAWLPELPPKANAPVSPYISEILQYLEVRVW